MIVRRYNVRAPGDLAALGTFLYEFVVEGAKKITIGFRATNGNTLASVAFERKAMGNQDGWQTTGTDFVLTGDTLTSGLNNGVAPGTVAAGREATWTPAGGAFHSPRVRIQGTNGAAIITAFEVWATVEFDSDAIVGTA